MIIRETSFAIPEFNRLAVLDHGLFLYQDTPWLQMLEMVLDRPVTVIGAWDGEKLLAALPIAICENRELGPVLNSLPFFGSIGGIMSSETGKILTDCFEKILGRLIGKIEETGAVSCTIISRPFDNMEELYHRFLQPDQEDSRTTYISALDCPPHEDQEEFLFRTFAGRTRTALRKALKLGYAVERTADPRDLARFYELHRQNIEDVNGIAKPPSFMKAVASEHGGKFSELWIARDGNKLIAGALFFFHRDTAEYYMTALDPDYRSQQPLSLIIFEAMKDFMARGIKRFNFGGTWPTQGGLEQFKASWGAVPATYRYFVKQGPNFKNILRLPQNEILQAFPFFYVYPFKAHAA